MKIAIASSGLGHVARGIETWALDTADALHRRGVDVTLFAAGKVPCEAPLVIIPCLRRRTVLSDLIVKLLPSFTWRWGLQSGYGLEQLTFWWRLKKRLRQGQYDILHIQDPMIADLCRKARAAGRVSSKEILAHGTEEPLEFLSKFDYLQHLAPWHLHQALKQLGERKQNDYGQNDCLDSTATLHSPPCPGVVPDEAGSPHPFWTAMPNFVDTELYCPVPDSGEKKLIRRNLRIPEDAFVIGTAAAVKKHHKRIDYLIREFAQFYREKESKIIKGKMISSGSAGGGIGAANGARAICGPNSSSNYFAPNYFASSPYLVIAGSWQNDTEELQALAEKLCPGRVKFLINYPHEKMPDLLRCYDVFALTSLFEMMPIALLEAIATGLPVVTNNHPVLEWMGGPGGIRPDMSQEGALAAEVASLTPERVKSLGQAARDHALENFSVDAVMQQYVEYYGRILE